MKYTSVMQQELMKP